MDLCTLYKFSRVCTIHDKLMNKDVKMGDEFTESHRLSHDVN